jgi:pyruvate dehydrogenase E2 component (dihydrolipoamide acetyltransferase)
MPTEVILPRVDMDMATGKVNRWFVEENAKVEKGQVIFEIETDKAAMEIEAPASGIIRDLTGESGEDVPVGSVVAMIYGEGEDYAGPVQAAPGAPTDIPTAADGLSEPAEPNPAVLRAAAPAAQDFAEDRFAIRATPLARRLAREHKVELMQLRGSGPHGRIQHSDVQDYVEAGHARRSAAAGESRTSPPGQPCVSERARSSAMSGPLHTIWLRRGTGTPFVLIHGFGSDLNSWRPGLSAMPADRPILGIDLPGHGRSAFANESALSDLTAAVLDALSADGIESLHLVGHSLGAAVAATVAAGSPLDVRSLLMLSPAGLGPDFNGAFLSGFLRATSEASLAPWIRELSFDERSLGAPFVRATLRARNGEMVQAQEQLAARLFPDGTQSFSIRHLFDVIDCPTKVVFGTEDRIIPARHAEGLPGTVALHLFSATGHMPQLEQREAIGRLTTELARLG